MFFHWKSENKHAIFQSLNLLSFVANRPMASNKESNFRFGWPQNSGASPDCRCHYLSLSLSLSKKHSLDDDHSSSTYHLKHIRLSMCMRPLQFILMLCLLQNSFKIYRMPALCPSLQETIFLYYISPFKLTFHRRETRSFNKRINILKRNIQWSQRHFRFRSIAGNRFETQMTSAQTRCQKHF